MGWQVPSQTRHVSPGSLPDALLSSLKSVELLVDRNLHINFVAGAGKLWRVCLFHSEDEAWWGGVSGLQRCLGPDRTATFCSAPPSAGGCTRPPPVPGLHHLAVLLVDDNARGIPRSVEVQRREARDPGASLCSGRAFCPASGSRLFSRWPAGLTSVSPTLCFCHDYPVFPSHRPKAYSLHFYCPAPSMPVPPTPPAQGPGAIPSVPI